MYYVKRLRISKKCIWRFKINNSMKVDCIKYEKVLLNNMITIKKCNLFVLLKKMQNAVI